MARKRKRKTAHSKRRKIENMMIPDDVLENILCRLSAKPLMRFRCASKRLNSLITDPNFINSRSRRMILVSSLFSHLIYALDGKHPNTTVCHTSPYEGEIKRSNIIGTFNGIVVLMLQSPLFVWPRIFILYNPLTRASKKLPDPPFKLCCDDSGRGNCAYGFGHGNIFFAPSLCACTSDIGSYCYVFSLKKGSWTKARTFYSNLFFYDEAGVYLNGFLYWSKVFTTQNNIFLQALDIKKMRFSNPPAPPPLSRDCYHLRSSVLGTCNGCLCLIAKWPNGFDVWMRTKNDNEGIEWSKQYSFASPIYQDNGFQYTFDFFILEDGRIVLRHDRSNQVIICHLSKQHGYDIFESTTRIGPFEKGKKGIEYVESLASPSYYKSLSYA